MGRPAIQQEDKICVICGKQFNRKRFGKRLEDISRYLSRKTCSQSCGNSKINPKNRTTYNLRARKTKKGIKCENCSAMQNLDVHHTDGDIKNNSPENLKILCHSCHMKLHWKLRKSGIIYNVLTQV